MLTSFILILAVFVLVVTVRRFGFLSAASISAFYIFGCLVVIYLVYFLNLDEADVLFSAMPLPDFSSVINEVFVVYFCLMVIPIFWSKNVIVNKGFVSVFINDAISIISERLCSRRIAPYVFISLFLFSAVSLIHFFSMDYEVLRSNTYYLTIKEPSSVGLDGGVGRIYHFLFRYVGLVYAVLFLIFYGSGRYVFSFLSFLIFFYSFLILLIGESRWAPLYMACILGFSLLRGYYVLVFLSAVVFYFSMQKVLIGRSLFYHGIDHFWDFYEYIGYSDIFRTLFGMVINVFEGGMNFANTLLHDPSFLMRYKVGSFSPFFSFIDGFDSYRDSMKYKWAPHVPMSSISESYQFGFVFFVAFIFVYYRIAYLIDRFFSSGNVLIGLLLLVVFVYVAFGVHTYSVRTFWKLMLFMLVVATYLNSDRSSQKGLLK